VTIVTARRLQTWDRWRAFFNMSNKKGETVFLHAALWIGSFFLFGIGSVTAAVNNHTPTTGQTVTADASLPNPDTIGSKPSPVV